MAFAVEGAEPRLEHLHRSPSGPIAITIGPFDFPQHPKRCWRIVGRFADRRDFLVVIGISPDDLMMRLDDALAGYSSRDLRTIRALWMERWSPGSRYEFPSWDPVQEVSLRPFRFRRTMRFKQRTSQLDSFLADTHELKKGVA
jgi:hypothetical protein